MTRSKKAGSKRTRRAFSPDFKLEAVRLLEERRAAGASLSQVGRELDVRPDLLRAWARQVKARAGSGARGVFPGQGPGPSTEAEVRRLQRENATLRQERDFLKKAAAFFAKESR
jgi:transposase